MGVFVSVLLNCVNYIFTIYSFLQCYFETKLLYSSSDECCKEEKTENIHYKVPSYTITLAHYEKTDYPVDSVVYSVVEQFVERASIGKKKYGTDLDRQDLEPIDWLQHAQEEHCDAILYLEKLKKEHWKKQEKEKKIEIEAEENTPIVQKADNTGHL